MNWLGRQAAAPFLARLPADLGGYGYSCDLRDSIAREVCFTGCYEPQETALLRTCLRRGMTFVDVGANWGYFTLLAAHCVGATGKVIALEPESRCFALLHDNIQRNGLSQVRVSKVAAADRDTSLPLTGYDAHGGNWGLSRLALAANHATTQVPARPLDDLLDEMAVAKVDLVKVDVEGAEALVLAGMAAGLARQRYDRILLELHPGLLAERGESVAEVLQSVLSAGYAGWRIDHSPQATRRAAYARCLQPRDWLMPLESGMTADPWPHVLLVRNGTEPLP